MHRDINIAVGGPINADYPKVYKTKFLKPGIPFASQVTEPNIKYVIKHNFDLDGGTVTIPANCVLEFDGGTIRNGILNIGYCELYGNGTTIYCPIILNADGYRDRGTLVNDITIDCLFKYDDAFTTTKVNYAVINNLRVRNFRRYGIYVGSDTFEAQFNNFECLSYELYENLERPLDLCNCGLYVAATDNHFFNGLIKHCWCGFYMVASDNVLENIHIWGSGGVTRVNGVVSSGNKLNNIYCDGPAAYNKNLDNLALIYQDIPYSINGPLGLLFTSSGNTVNNVSLTARDAESYGDTYLFSTTGNAWGNVINNVVVPDHFDGNKIILYNGGNNKYRADNYLKITNINTKYGGFDRFSFFSDRPDVYRYISGPDLVINNVLDSYEAPYESVFSRERLIKSRTNFDILIRQVKSNKVTFDYKSMNGTSLPQIILSQNGLSVGGKDVQVSVSVTDTDINNLLDSGIYYGYVPNNTNVPYDSGFFVLQVQKLTQYTILQSLIHTDAGASSVCHAIYRTIKVNGQNVKTIDEWTYSDGSMAFRHNGWNMPYGNYLFEGLQHFHPQCKKPVYWDGERWVYSNGFKAIDGSSIIPVSGNTASRPKLSTEQGGVLDATKDVGFEYYDWELGKKIIFKKVRDGKVHWCDANGFTATNTVGTTAQRPIGWHDEDGTKVGVLDLTTDIGFMYYDTTLHLPIYADIIDVTTGTITWIKADGTPADENNNDNA